MRKQLDDLLDDSSSDSWRRRSEFAAYREAIKGISELGDVNNGGREFFHTLPKVFLKTFVVSYSKLVESCWRHWKILSYIVAGNPVLAQMYLNWLVIADEGNDMRDYCWPSKTIELEHHTTYGETVEIDTRSCMEYLTEKASKHTEKILADPLIKDNKDLLWQMAAANQPVDLFDATTWPSGVDFEPLCDMIHAMIAPHMCQNQRIESYVQMHAVVAKTNVKEVRRSNRSVLHSTIVRPFNQESVEQKRSTIESMKDKEKIKRVKGRERIEKYGEYVLDLNAGIDQALVDITPELYKDILLDMTSKENKSSAIELQKNIDMYERGSKKKRQVTRSEENKNGMHITPEMGGKIVLSALQKGKGHITHVGAELADRGVEAPVQLKDMKWKEVIDLLKMDEYKRLVGLELARDIDHWTSVTQVEPQSDKLMELFDYQADYFLQKRSKQTGL